MIATLLHPKNLHRSGRVLQKLRHIRLGYDNEYLAPRALERGYFLRVLTNLRLSEIPPTAIPPAGFITERLPESHQSTHYAPLADRPHLVIGHSYTSWSIGDPLTQVTSIRIQTTVLFCGTIVPASAGWLLHHPRLSSICGMRTRKVLLHSLWPPWNIS